MGNYCGKGEETLNPNYDLNYKKGAAKNAGAHAPKSFIAEPVEFMLSCNERVKRVLTKLEPFTPSCDQDLEDFPPLGPYKYEDEATYRGAYLNGNRWGFGKQVWPDGSYFEGCWKEDKICGKGRLVSKEGDVYDGEFQNNRFHGYGEYTQFNGNKYKGQWANDKQNGIGKEIWMDGTTYQGDYLNGMKHGRGEFTWSNGSFYEGDYKNNEIEGVGKNNQNKSFFRDLYLG